MVVLNASLELDSIPFQGCQALIHVEQLLAHHCRCDFWENRHFSLFGLILCLSHWLQSFFTLINDLTRTHQNGFSLHDSSATFLSILYPLYLLLTQVVLIISIISIVKGHNITHRLIISILPLKLRRRLAPRRPNHIHHRLSCSFHNSLSQTVTSRDNSLLTSGFAWRGCQ